MDSRPMGAFLVVNVTIVSVMIAYGVSQVPTDLRGGVVLALFVLIPLLAFALTRRRETAPGKHATRRKPTRTTPRRRPKRKSHNLCTRALRVVAADADGGSRVTIR